jgi:hypothetical protein
MSVSSRLGALWRPSHFLLGNRYFRSLYEGKVTPGGGIAPPRFRPADNIFLTFRLRILAGFEFRSPTSTNWMHRQPDQTILSGGSRPSKKAVIFSTTFMPMAVRVSAVALPRCGRRTAF